MLYEFCYYLAIVGTFRLSFVSGTYYFNRPLFNDMSRRAAWKGLGVYHDVTTFISYILEEEEEEDSDDEDEFEDASKNTILSYTTHDGKTATLSYIPPINDLLFFKKKIEGDIYCKRISEKEDISNLQIVPVKKQFIQVELKYDDKSVDIHEHLPQFYVQDNHILDELFLKWYMKFWFCLDLPVEYTVNIIDNDVNIFILSSRQSVIFKDDKYVIVSKPIDEDNTKEEEEKVNIVK